MTQDRKMLMHCWRASTLTNGSNDDDVKSCFPSTTTQTPPSRLDLIIMEMAMQHVSVEVPLTL